MKSKTKIISIFISQHSLGPKCQICTWLKTCLHTPGSLSHNSVGNRKLFFLKCYQIIMYPEKILIFIDRSWAMLEPLKNHFGNHERSMCYCPIAVSLIVFALVLVESKLKATTKKPQSAFYYYLYYHHYYKLAFKSQINSPLSVASSCLQV